jgi:4-aminobutyrate aminotransferase/(S)-3-amino-2-methylpropionate transaminase
LPVEVQPEIVVKPPGPKSQELMKAAQNAVARGVHIIAPVFVERAQGSIIEDVDGNKYIDFATGISSLNFGHQPHQIVEAVKKQLDKYMHLCYHVTPYEPYVRLAQKLDDIYPGGVRTKAVLVNSGAEAVENAVKIAMRHSGKSVVMAFEYSFHGRTRLALSLTGSVHPYKYGFGPGDSHIYRIPYAYCYRCPFGLEPSSCGMHCLQTIENTLKIHLSPDEVAAMIVEPVEGEGGFIVPPDGFLKGLRRICDENEILLIADEIQTGMGRTGRMFAVEHSDIVPDIMTMAKSLGGGVPLAATVGRAEVLDSVQVGGLGGTFGGNPVSCEAALKAIDLIQEIMPAGIETGTHLRKRLEELYLEHEIIGDVRGLGAMVAVELVKNRDTKEPAMKERDAILTKCLEQGLLVMGAGSYKNVIRFLPALNIPPDLLSAGLDIFEKALRDLE